MIQTTVPVSDHRHCTKGQEHLEAPGVWKFGLLAEPVTTAGIVGWPRLYIIDMCEVYLSQQGTRQHSDSNLREDGVYSRFFQDIYSQLGNRLERQ
jgi:hypothetical protein